jgi:hypothetical protein
MLVEVCAVSRSAAKVPLMSTPRRPLPGSGPSLCRKSDTENIVRHTATVMKDQRTAASARPNSCGLSVISTLIRNNKPPPRYPRAKPSAEMRWRVLDGATMETVTRFRLSHQGDKGNRIPRRH